MKEEEDVCRGRGMDERTNKVRKTAYIHMGGGEKVKELLGLGVRAPFQVIGHHVSECECIVGEGVLSNGGCCGNLLVHLHVDHCGGNGVVMPHLPRRR